MVGASQRDGVGGEAEGLGAVAEVVIGLGGQEPSEVVKGFQPVGLEAQRLGEMLRGAVCLAERSGDHS
jgi:hypothetical protein